MPKKIIIFLAVSAAVLILLLGRQIQNNEPYLRYARFLPVYDLYNYPPKVLVYSSMTSEYLIEHAKELRQNYGFDGFILTQLPSDWPGQYQDLVPLTNLVRKGNQSSAAAGIRYNFLKIGLEQGTFPKWEDENSWQKDLKEIQATSAWAKKTGFRGIAFDTETYHKLIFNEALERNKLPGIEKLIFKRGRQIIEAVRAGFPAAEVLVFPEGQLFCYTTTKPHKYRYWIHLFNGMLSAELPQGINLLAERTYTLYHQFELQKIYYELRGEIIGDSVSNPHYWLERCSIALGLWPLGREYSDKRANLTVDQFEVQFNSALQYCPRYVWIYAHGLSWWQTASGKKYKFNPREAALPTAKKLVEYQNIVLKSKEENLKYFYKELKYNRKYNYLERFLEKIFNK